VSYKSDDLDTWCASVADRLRKQAKTRAVKVLREAIADPVCGATTRILRGFAGAHAPSLCLDKYILSRSSYIGSDRSRSYVVFPAKNKCGAEGGKAACSASSAGIYIPICMCVYMYIHICMCMYMYIHVYIYVHATCINYTYHTCKMYHICTKYTYAHVYIYIAAASHTVMEPRAAAGDAQLTAFFPVSLFITAIGDGALARDISSKLKVIDCVICT
jgi:hypothetical protein